jgi:hypothetical protein
VWCERGSFEGKRATVFVFSTIRDENISGRFVTASLGVREVVLEDGQNVIDCDVTARSHFQVKSLDSGTTGPKLVLVSFLKCIVKEAKVFG